MGTEGKYGIITAEKKEFHPNEPLFLFRATDPLTVTAIKMYTALAEFLGADYEFIDQLTDHAERIENWQRENSDLVKTVPN